MLWKNRSFLKMFTAYGLSAFGDYFDFIAISILLGFVWKADAMMVSLVPLAFAIPSILFSQLAGIMADRWNKRNLMIVTDLIRSAFTIGLIFAPNVWVLLGLITLRAAARVFHYPAQQAMTRHIVGTDQLLQATSLNGAVFQLSKVLGPLFGASIATAFSPAICMAVNAVCFIVSALLLMMIPASEGLVESSELPSESIKLRTAWKEGWNILLQSRTLLVSLFFSLLGMAGILMIDAQVTILLRDVAPDRPELIGWIVTAVGAGGLISVMWLRRFQQLSAYGWLLGGGLLLIGLMFAGAGTFVASTPLLWILIVSFIGGLGTGFTSTGMNYIMQKETPSTAIGRISGIYDSLMSTVSIIAPLTGGVLIGLWGASLMFVWVGLAIGAVGLLGVLFQRYLWKKQVISTSSSMAV
ncbi:MFS transporter [Brevibacillus fluminis]|uniref:MFS transporter n=1 Tax=Brevibacillus fluminis TaxID=511487 RepID=A0A3M8CYR9_9BACL|nr:MFS transporter [Brevibacillus fluminis]RNB81002.1 MFS transporter [Brevibacillus fluminis]